MTETKRGRILRDTNAGPGVVTIDGRQHSFTLDGMWTSDVPPRTGMTVDVLCDEQGVPLTVRAVAEGNLAREQAQQALRLPSHRAWHWQANSRVASAHRCW